MRRIVASAVVLVWLTGANAASADDVVEAWRSPFGEVRSVSVNHTDGSCWVAAGCSVMHLRSDGTILSQVGGFTAPGCVSVNSTDGSCWVAAGGVIHLAKDGRELLRVGGFDRVSALSVNPADGSCWVGHSSGERVDARQSEVVHLAEDGAELLRLGGLDPIYAVSVNAADGSCWVAHGYYYFVRPVTAERPERDTQQILPSQFFVYQAEVLHLAEDGAELWRGEDFDIPSSLSVNPADGSCWVAEKGNVLHLAEDGTELSLTTDIGSARAVSANPADGSCWVAVWGGSFDAVIHLAEDGTELARVEDVRYPRSISVYPTDGSCWAADANVDTGGRVVHLAEDGAELWSGGSFLGSPHSLLVNPADGSCWVSDTGLDAVVHLAEDGRLLWQRSELGRASVEAIDPADGSCWVHSSGGVIHLAQDGTELLLAESPPSRGRTSFQLNPADGSWWMCEYAYDQQSVPYEADVVHFAHDGSELLRVGGFRYDKHFAEHPRVAVNPVDGSCWVRCKWEGGGPYEVYHLAEDGEVLLHLGGFDALSGPSVDPADGSCWMTQSYWNGDTHTWRGEVLHLEQDETELLRLAGFGRLGALSVVPADGSCWVLESQWNPEDWEYEHEIVHLAQNGDELARAWGSSTERAWYFPRLWANPADGSCWVYLSYELPDGRDRGELVYLACDGTEVWRGAAFERLSDLSVNPADGSCWVADSEARQVVHLLVLRNLAFADVGFYHWARDEVKACVDAAIVCGYPDGLYHPDWPTSRAQMAVYISRAVAGGDDRVPEGPPVPTFQDVPATHWAYRYIEYAHAQRIVEGLGPRVYLPDATVNRGMMSVFIARSIVNPTGDKGLVAYIPPDTPTYDDVTASNQYGWCYKHVEYLAEQGIAQGYPNGLYCPSGSVTRGQMAVYLCRAFDLPT